MTESEPVTQLLIIFRNLLKPLKNMFSLNFIFNIIDFTKIDFTEVYIKYFFTYYVVTVMKNEVYFGVVIVTAGIHQSSHVTLVLIEMMSMLASQLGSMGPAMHSEWRYFWFSFLGFNFVIFWSVSQGIQVFSCSCAFTS